jgi:CRP/FNR family transcriptional regulator, cyclic AMP receptor protein
MAVPATAIHSSGASPEEIVSVLRAAQIFTELPEDALARLADASVRRTFRRGQYLFFQGDEGARLVVIASGMVKVMIASDQGEEVVLTTLGPGATLGELALLDGAPRSASVVAVEPTSVLMLSRATVLDVLAHYPSVLDALLRSLGALVRRLTEQTGDLVFLDLPARVAKVLLRLAEGQHPAEGPVVLDLGLSQSDLAAMVGATRPAVNRVLQSMARRGLLAVHGQVIELLDVPALRRRATA